MISYYELMANSSIYRVRSDLRKDFDRCEVKGYLPMLVLAADKVTMSLFRRRIITEEERNEALSLVDPLEILNSIEKHCDESNNLWVIERAVMGDFGENKEREDISKSYLVFLLILKVVISLIIMYWWKHNKPDQELKTRSHIMRKF